MIGWSFDRHGPLEAPGAATNVVALAAGYQHALGVRADATVLEWGYYTVGSERFPACDLSGLSNVLAVAVGAQNLALRADGTVISWDLHELDSANLFPILSNVLTCCRLL